MKKHIIVFGFLLIFLTSCMIQFRMPYNNYLTIGEIKSKYKLTYKECRTIIEAAELNEIDCKYDINQECWTYDDTIDYNLFKIAK
jgi:hypothetical protein